MTDTPRDEHRYRFVRRNRLVSRGAFGLVYASGIRVVAGPLVVLGRPNDLGLLRLGMSVPKRVGSAVVRTRVKRMLREAFRLKQHELPSGYDVVINVRPHEPLPLADYQRLIDKALRRIDMVCKKRNAT